MWPFRKKLPSPPPVVEAAPTPSPKPPPPEPDSERLMEPVVSIDGHIRPTTELGPTYDLSWETNHVWEKLKQEDVLFMDEETLYRLFRIGRPRGFYRLFLDMSKDDPILQVDPWPRLNCQVS